MKIIIFILFFILNAYEICKNNFFNFIFEINNKEILIIEKLNYHGECLPGFIKYFLDLGYKNIDILMNIELYKLRPLNISFFENKINILPFPPKIIENFIILGICNFYKICFFNTMNFGMKNKIKKYLYKNQNFKKLIVFHDLNYIEKKDFYKFKIIVLKKFQNITSIFEVNPHFFGELKFHNKSKITNFIIVGNVQSNRKNFLILFESIEQLIKNKINNFNVTIIGYSMDINFKEFFNKKHLSKYIKFIEKIPYDIMFEYISKADFFLPLLDSKIHTNYLKVKTSGSFQLVYGFNIPIIIEKIFAEKYGFNNSNSIIYNNSMQDFFNKLNYSIYMKNDEYLKLKYNLKLKTKEIEKNSIDNLKLILNC